MRRFATWSERVAPWFALALSGALLLTACRSRPEAPPPDARREIVGWRRLGSWSGRGNLQTEAFTSETGGFRVTWNTTNASRPGAGTLKVTFRSGDSGNSVMEAVDAKGVDHDVAYVGDRPRWYYLTIESTDVDWSVVVDEPIYGRNIKETKDTKVKPTS
jgi:hypothetical protein